MRRLTGPPGLASVAMDTALKRARVLTSLAEGRVRTGPSNDYELWTFVRDVYGIEIPRHESGDDFCKERGHVPPFRAFADAYFARDEVSLWLGSRGFSGKTYMSALLCFLEETILGADVALLGGSLEQALHGHEYTKLLWDHENAPRYLLLGDPTARMTRLANGGRERVLAASSRSVRGGHPQRLRIDEADETTIEIVDAALGQPMGKEHIPVQVLFSSTHHYADGTVTELKKRAAEKDWKVHEWCWRESLRRQKPGGGTVGWLLPQLVDQARRRITAEMFRVEYDLGQPSIEGRALPSEVVDSVFDVNLGRFVGENLELIEMPCCEDYDGMPCSDHAYSTGIDWGRKRDWSVITTYRTDVTPWFLVAFERARKTGWDVILSDALRRVERYPGEVVHDATSLGGDLLDTYVLPPDWTGFVMAGPRRQAMFTNYLVALERGDMIHPRIETLYRDHLYLTNDMLYGSGHPPDAVVAGALAWSSRGVEIDVTGLAPVGVGNAMFFR